MRIRAAAHRRSQACAQVDWGDDTMHLACEHCGKSYSLNEDRLPRFGARVRCPSCGDLFDIPARRSGATRAPAPRWTAPSPFEATAFGLERLTPDDTVGGLVTATAVLAPSESAIPAGAAATGADAVPAETPVESASHRVPSEGPLSSAGAPDAARMPAPSPDPAVVARRLVGSLAETHRARLDAARREGRVLAVFGAEIASVWDLYRLQVQEEASGSRRHFQDAVNEFFFDGERIF